MPKRRPAPDEPDKAAILAALTQPHPLHPRAELAGMIIATAQDSLAGFMRKHPEWADDERARSGMEFFMFFAAEVLELLDEFEMTRKVQAEPEQIEP